MGLRVSCFQSVRQPKTTYEEVVPLMLRHQRLDSYGIPARVYTGRNSSAPVIAPVEILATTFYQVLGSPR